MIDKEPATHNPDQEHALEYRPFRQTELWLKERCSQTSHGKTIYTAASATICIFMLLGLGAVFANAIWEALGTQSAGASEYALRAAANHLILLCFSILGGGALIAAALAYYSRPTHLCISGKGLRFKSQHALFTWYSPGIAWDALSSVQLKRQIALSSHGRNSLIFTARAKPAMKIVIDTLDKSLDRQQLLAAIKTWAPLACQDESVIEALQSPRDKAYTELWLEALRAPPRRESLRPLIEGAVLREGKFKIIGVLAAGGQGTAYLAWDLQSGQTVVLKEFIFPVYVEIGVRRQALRDFENEARILEKLDHPGIVKLLDFFAEDQRGYLVLEYIEGTNLKEKVAEQGPFSEESVRTLVPQLCALLDFLHAQSPPVVHRDFTPDNLIYQGDGTVKLIDFNVAQWSDSETTSAPAGKLAYLPPEQFRGRASVQSDVYALGGTLFFLLTGHDPEPIAANHPQLLDSRLTAEIDQLVARATEPDQGRRFKTAGDLARGLRPRQSG